jgi:hypothetical protein
MALRCRYDVDIAYLFRFVDGSVTLDACPFGIVLHAEGLRRAYVFRYRQHSESCIVLFVGCEVRGDGGPVCFAMVRCLRLVCHVFVLVDGAEGARYGSGHYWELFVTPEEVRRE